MLKKLVISATLLGTFMAHATVEINHASEAELDGVKGLGPSTTAQILAERQKAPFKDWADLMTRLKGFKAARATKLSSDGLVVNGAPYPGQSPTAAAPSSQSAAPKTH